jgi:serine-type D-Ala-D-Ala carboxypeptidase/endopeptidase (penicillin-binding protein 4)
MGDLSRVAGPLVAAVEGEGFAVGVAIEDVSGAGMFAHRAGEPFVLASNTKLFTTAAAAVSLPPDSRWRTEARWEDGSLWIIGRGDATFHIIDGYSYPDHFLDQVAEALDVRGIDAVEQLVIDARYFDAAYQHPDWPRNQLRRRYSAPVSGLPYARGLVRVQRGRSSVYSTTGDPVATVTNFLVRGLRKRGLDVQRARSAGAREVQPPEFTSIYRHESPWSLEKVLRETNAESDNYLAEHLFKTLGAEFHGRGSFDGAAEAVRVALAAAGASLDDFTQLDGSGLARTENGGNRASAETVTSLLRAMAKHPAGGPFLRSMAINGRRGTLSHRLDKGPMAGAIHAKTGWIKGSLALSGYMRRDEDRVVVFSILVNYDAPYTYDRRQVVLGFHEDLLRAVWDHLDTVDTGWGAPPPALVQALEPGRAAN